MVAGATVAYLVTVTDVGPSNASGVTVTDTLPAGVSLVAATGPGWTCTYAGNVSATCTRPVLAAGTSAPAITVTLIAPPQAGTLANTAFVASTTADPNPANNTATATTAVTASADLSVAKTGPATVSAGAAVTYNLVVMNSGPSDAGNISVTDTLPAGVRFVSAAGGGWTCTNSGDVSATCTRATLAAGATAPLIALTVTAPAAAATLTDTAVVSSGTPDPVPGNNTSSATTTVTALADLAITKTGPATVTAAGTVSYALVVVDNGPSAASTVVVTDTLPAGVTLVSAAGPGWACTHSGNVLVTCARATLATGPAAPPIAVVVTAPTQGGTLSNTASVAAATTDPNLGNNSSSVATTVDPSADLSIVKSGPSQVQVGASIRYLLAIKNAGPSDARLLTVTDTLPAGVTFVSAAGAGWACLNSGDVSVTCTRPALQSGAPAPLVTVVVTAPGSAGTLTNSADVTSATFDPVPGNNTSTWITSVGAAADLSLSKTGPSKVAPGSSVVYELTVTNHGPSDATAVVVTDTLPAGVTLVSVAGAGWTCTPLGTAPLACHLPGLTSGTTTPPITVTVTAPAHAANLVNTAAVSSAVNDPVPGNNTSAVTTAVGAVADLSLVKTGPARVDAGSAITYRLVVSNAGPDPAAAVVVNDTLPSGVTYVSAAGSGWSCNHVADVTVNCTRASLASGTSAPPVLVVVLGPDVATTLVNVANVAAATFDPVAANNGSTASTAVFALVLAPLPRTGGDGLISGPVGLLTLVLGVVLVTAARRWSD